MRKKILVISPDHHDLPRTNIEISAIQRHHDAKVLRGVVRDEDIAEAITQDEYEILWFVSHGTIDGVILSDNELLATSALIQYAKRETIDLVVFNTCDSEETAIQVAGESQVDVICTIVSVDKIHNRDAIRLGQLLAAELASTITYREAYELVSSDSSNYRYYSAGGTRSGYRNSTFEQDIIIIKEVLFGRYGVGGMVHQVEKMRDEINELAKFKPLLLSIEAMQKNSTSIPVYVFYGVLLLVLISIVALFIIIAIGRGA